LKGFTKDGKFRPTGNKTKSPLKKSDIGRNKVSLRQRLDRAGSENGVSPETYAIELFESTMQGNGEVRCSDITQDGGSYHCDFKITQEELHDKYNDNDEKASGDLWTHAYSHVRPYKRDKKTLEGSKISTNEDAERNNVRDWDALGVTVWDAGDDANDRYTVVHKSKWNDYRNNDKETNTKYFFAMNGNPFSPDRGFNQFVGQTEDGYKEGRHLGKKIDPQTLNVDVRLAILDRITNEEGIVV
jgi:hypothetical protein